MKKMNLKMAAIMDEFTYCCYAPECDIMQITPDHFKEEIDSFTPDLLFIESVWRGKDNLWRFKLHDNMEAITALTSYCHEKNIPVVFWSKEDPVHFGVFIRTAALADYVFTTDADCVELYKAHLGHGRVYFLPFAAQPATHNPIEEYERKDKFCFAGSFYVKYQERSKVFMELSPLFLEHGLDIYDRNFKKAESDNNAQTTSVASPVVENYVFPKELQESILGGLPYSEISKAYKGYKYGINMTSMVHSGFMFARRVFELLASNTVTVSNYSRGLELFFGNLIIATNDKDTMKRKLEKYCGSETDYRKFRLAGLRHVLSEHLYEDRLDRITNIVLKKSIANKLPQILVLCSKKTDKIKKMFDSQTYENKILVETSAKRLGEYPCDFITCFDENDYYGRNYLMDLALTTRYASDKIIGKSAYYTSHGVVNREHAYTRQVEEVSLRRQMAEVSIFDKEICLNDICSYSAATTILAIDEFNYCENAQECREVDDIDVYSGFPLHEIYEYTDRIKPVSLHKTEAFALDELGAQVHISDEDKVKKTFDKNMLCLSREADDDEIVWLRTEKNYTLSDYTSGSRIGFFSKVEEKTGNVRCQIEYYDADNKKLGFLNFALDGFTLLRIHDGATSFKLIFRMRGKSSVKLTEMYVSSPDTQLPAVFPTQKSVLITNNYPDYQKNGNRKLHSFAVENNLEVLKVSELPCYLPYSEYNGIQIVSVQYCAVEEYLSAAEFDKIYVDKDSEYVLDYMGENRKKVIII